MENYVTYLVKPDGTLPILGDSSVDSIYPLKNIISNKLKYAVTKVLRVKPSGNAIYPDGGVAIFHNMWGKNTPFYFYSLQLIIRMCINMRMIYPSY